MENKSVFNVLVHGQEERKNKKKNIHLLYLG